METKYLKRYQTYYEKNKENELVIKSLDKKLKDLFYSLKPESMSKPEFLGIVLNSYKEKGI